MPDQPIRHRAILVMIGFLTVFSAPFVFVGRPVRMAFGIPWWLWWSMLCTVLLSCVTAWSVLRLWKDDTLD